MYFIAMDKLNASTKMMTCRGPFPDLASAIAAAGKLLFPGDYTIYGPANAVHTVTISPPIVKSNAIPEK